MKNSVFFIVHWIFWSSWCHQLLTLNYTIAPCTVSMYLKKLQMTINCSWAGGQTLNEDTLGISCFQITETITLSRLWPVYIMKLSCVYLQTEADCIFFIYSCSKRHSYFSRCCIKRNSTSHRKKKQKYRGDS